jgi:hypothetical protein
LFPLINRRQDAFRISLNSDLEDRIALTAALISPCPAIMTACISFGPVFTVVSGHFFYGVYGGNQLRLILFLIGPHLSPRGWHLPWFFSLLKSELLTATAMCMNILNIYKLL